MYARKMEVFTFSVFSVAPVAIKNSVNYSRYFTQVYTKFSDLWKFSSLGCGKDCIFLLLVYIYIYMYSLGVKGSLVLLTACYISLFSVSSARNKIIMLTEDRGTCCQFNILLATATYDRGCRVTGSLRLW